MTRVRVVQIVGNGDGGGTHFVMNLVDSLDPGRFALTVIAPEAKWIAERCAHAGATYAPLPLMQSRTSRGLRGNLVHLLGKSDADVVHAHGTRAAWYASRCLPRMGARPIFFYSEHLFSFDARSGLARLPWYAIERALCRYADVVLTSSPLNARRILAMRWVSPERIGCDRAGFPAAQIQRQIASPVPRHALSVPWDAQLVGSVGRLVPQKGWIYLLESFAVVARACPTSYLIVIGDGEQRASLEARARALGIAGRVRFLGAQTNPWSWLIHCDVIACTSLWEGGWIVPLEAVSARLPLVVTRVGGTQDFVTDGQNGLLVPPRDAQALAKAMITLLLDPAQRAAMRAARRDALAEYDVRDVQAKIVALYERAALDRRFRRDRQAVPGPTHTASVRWRAH
jgi:glycosyltransferase involved in cell wall biosynthesis